MKANLENIQKIYLDVPDTWIVDGVRIDNYKKSNDHFSHGWRDVVIPEISEHQILSSEYILVGEIITKEVIDFTPEEIEVYNRSLIPKTISRMKFIIQIKRTTGIKYEDIEIFINNIPDNILDDDSKYEIITRLKAAVDFNRYNPDLLTIAQMKGITSEQLDEIFINGNLLD